MGVGVLINSEVMAKFRKAAGFTQAELAERAGLAERTIQRWENPGKIAAKASLASIGLVANALGVERRSLVQANGGESAEFKGDAWSITHPQRPAAVVQPIMERPDPNLVRGRDAGIWVPLYRSVSASGTSLNEDMHSEMHYAPRGTDFAVVVDGDCMEPVYKNGEIVFVSVDWWKARGFRPDAEYWILFLNGETTLKLVRMIADEPEKFLLEAYNKARHRPQIRLLADIARAGEIIGKQKFN